MSEFFQAVAVKDIKKGEFVRKLAKDGTMQSKTYTRGDYDRASKSYSLIDWDNTGREVFVKSGVKLAVGFTF